MQWMPQEVRYCFVSESYDRRASAKAGKKVAKVRLKQVPEARLTVPIAPTKIGMEVNGLVWQMVTYEHTTDEIELLGEVAAFFHFRHWDDFLATEGKETILPSVDEGPEGNRANIPDCVFLWLRRDGVLAFEECKSAIAHQNTGAE